jgi:hypothetical protein
MNIYPKFVYNIIIFLVNNNDDKMMIKIKYIYKFHPLLLLAVLARPLSED